MDGPVLVAEMFTKGHNHGLKNDKRMIISYELK